MIMIINFTMVEQMHLSIRFKAVKVSDDAECCLGLKGTKCLPFSQHFLSTKDWSFHN